VSTRRIATSTLWQIASQGTMAILSILTVKLVAVGLSKELAGSYNSAYGYLQLFGILADFGLYAVAVREVSQAKDQGRVLGAVLILRIGTMILSLSAALILAWIIPLWKGTPLPPSIAIAALVPFFTLLAGMLRTVFQIQYAMHYVFIAEVSQRVIALCIIGLLVWSGIRESVEYVTLYAFLLAGGVGAFALLVLSMIFALPRMKIRLCWDPKLLWKMISLAAPFGIAYLCVALYRQFDLTLIALLRPDFEIQNAHYGFVVRITDMAYLIPTFLLNSTLPALKGGTHSARRKALLGRTFFLTLLIGTLFFLFSFLWARPLMQLLTADRYLSTFTSPGADTALRLLALPMLLNGFILYSFYTLLAQHTWKPLVSSLGIGVLFSLLFNLWLIPLYGFVGAGITSIITHLLLVLLLLPQSLRVAPMQLPKGAFWQWVALSLPLALILLALAPSLSRPLETLEAVFGTLLLAGTLLRVTGVLEGVCSQR
jgi:polysaccharide transporter, PST family